MAAPKKVKRKATGNGAIVARRILVVDDSADAAESSALLLRLDAHEVQVALDGPAALEAARTFRPDIVLLDIGLPGLSGYEVARRLRQMQPSPRPVVIAITGYGQNEDQQRSREAGFDQHRVKPVDREYLNEVIASYSVDTTDGARPESPV